MKKTDDTAALVKKQKRDLGREIAKLRKTSMRQLAEAVKIPPSNMKYIEDGVNAPSPEVYASLIHHLRPPEKQRKKMDGLYSSIRGAPPPDVCKIIIENEDLNNVIRSIEGRTLSTEHIRQMMMLVQSFPLDNKKE